MSDLRTSDVQFFNRLYRASSDDNGTRYIVHADQVEGLTIQEVDENNNITNTYISIYGGTC